MAKYAAFSDRFNGPVKYLAEDLHVNRYFVIQEGRVAYQEKGRFHFEDGTSVPANRVWVGDWPKGIHVLKEVIAHVEADRKANPAPVGAQSKQAKRRNNVRKQRTGPGRADSVRAGGPAPSRPRHDPTGA